MMNYDKLMTYARFFAFQRYNTGLYNLKKEERDSCIKEATKLYKWLMG